MRAVILAAGMGTRLRPVSDDCPKALVEVGGKPLLMHSLDALNSYGIREVILVLGFLHEAIKKSFGSRYKNLNVVYVRNREFSTTGSMYSLSQARNAIGDADALVLESDLLFDMRAIGAVVEAPHDNVLLAAGISRSGDEVFLCADRDGRLTNLGKAIPMEAEERAVGELAGISRFSNRFLNALFNSVEHDYRNGDVTFHYEESVLSLSRLGMPVHVLCRKDLPWIEIDREEDLRRARRDIYPRLRSLNRRDRL